MERLRVIDFAYGMMFIHDSGVQNPAIEWIEAYTAQGFARTAGVVNLVMGQEYGVAVVATTLTSDVPWPECDSGLLLPFHVPSGKVLLEGPEDPPPFAEFRVPPGHYAVTVAQRVARKGKRPVVEVYLGFERVDAPLQRSRILKVGPGMNPPAELIETAELLP